MVAAIKPAQPPRTSILTPSTGTRPRAQGQVGSAATAFSRELHPVPPLHLDAAEPTPEALQKQFMDAFETLRRGTLPMRQNPASAPCHSRGVVTSATPQAPAFVLVPHALGRPHTGAHCCRHQGTPWQGHEAVAGSVAYIAVTAGGKGYTTPPQVVVSGGGGNGVQAEAVLQNGAVSYVRVNAAGAGHSGAPTVSFAGGGGSGAAAQATMPMTGVDPAQAVQMVTTSTGTYDFLTFGD